MRLGLVVEGSHLYHKRTQADLLEQLWSKEIPRVIGCVTPTKVFGITKGSLAAMRLKKVKFRRTTATREPLDAILERERLAHNIDCFVVVWDLVPPWDKQAQLCRWNETLGLYEGLSLSETLDERFRSFAAARFTEMSQRAQPGARTHAPKLVRGAVLGVCVDPLFESVFMDERAMKKALGISGKRARGWPPGWDDGNATASEIIGAAVDAGRDIMPPGPIFRKIRQGYETLKTECGIHFVQSGAFDNTLRRHPLGTRLAEIRP
jgi:hypothetical protein